MSMSLKPKQENFQMSNIVTSVADWRVLRAMCKRSIGFVPTMGNLHEGHLSLLARAKKENEVTIASIFVNQAQFNDLNDYEQYPRTLHADLKKLQALKIDYVFLPSHSELYPDDYQVKVQETTMSKILEGASRPGHFEGMLTVVLKLFNIIQPTRAYFGEKDYQQLLLIKKMVASLFLPIDIIQVETVRAPDAVALSSRNNRLQESERQKAAYFASLLASTHTCEEITRLLEEQGCQVDYIEEKWGRRLGAVRVGNVRLIDNVVR